MSLPTDGESGVPPSDLERFATLGRCLASISHDLNNLFSIMRGVAEELQETAPGPATNDLRAALAQGSAMTAQLRRFVRSEPARPRPVRVRTALDGLEPLLRRVAGASMTLRLSHELNDETIAIDPADFDRAVINLVCNSAAAVSAGGRIDIASLRGRGEVAEIGISVADSGKGMPPDLIESTLRGRLDGPQDGMGLGLGLTMVAGVARRAGGRLDIESVLGKGTAVRVWFPVMEPSSNKDDLCATMD